ncbi:MAG: helix-turn-helix domain-containing protein [Myxococcota bacterium]
MEDVSHEFALSRPFRAFLENEGIHPSNVLRRASLPADLFSREEVRLTPAEFFAFWRAVEAESERPAPWLIGLRHLTVELFDPLMFAALCCPDLNEAAARLAPFKRLVAPVEIDVQIGAAETRVASRLSTDVAEVPASFFAVECFYFLRLAQIATRRPDLQPTRVELEQLPDPLDAYAAFAGIQLTRGERNAITFDAKDAAHPFLTADAGMWKFFEPELNTRLSQVKVRESVADRVATALLELLPGGRGSVGQVAKTLGVSERTLQRKLHGEGKNFQTVLGETRAKLARHYLANSDLSTPEIALLVGFEDSTSFFRAYRDWTGTTPKQSREAMRTDG